MTAWTGPADPGLQPERTALAWRRTALAVMLAPAVAARLALDGLGGWAVAAAVGGVGLGAALLVLGGRRYRRIHAALEAQDAAASGGPAPSTPRLPGAGLLALLAGAMTSIALGLGLVLLLA